MKIHHRHTGAVIFEGKALSIAKLIAEAVRLRFNLNDANLGHADLRGADFRGAGLVEQK